MKKFFRLLPATALAVLSVAAVAPPATAQLLLNQVPGRNGLQQRMGNAVQNTCVGLVNLGVSVTGTTPTSDLLVQCSALVGTAVPVYTAPNVAAGPLGLNANQLNGALLQVSNDQAGAIGMSQTQVAFVQVANIQQRFMALRDGASGFSIAGLNPHPGENAPLGEPAAFQQGAVASAFHQGAASGDARTLPEGLGIFVTPNGNWGNFSGSSEQLGFHSSLYGVTGGVDYRFTDELVAGVAFGYEESRAGFKSSNGHMDQDSYVPSIYASYNQEGGLYADVLLSYVYDTFDLTRRINYSTIHRAATGDTSANGFSGSLGGGYEFDLAQVAKGLTLGPRARFDYSYQDVGSFSESGASGLNLHYQDYQVESAVSVIGAEASYAISTGFGVLTPQLRVDWDHEFAEAPSRVKAQFVADPNQLVFYVRPARLNRDFARLGVGIVGTFAHGVSTFIDWETVLGLNNVVNNAVHLGARYEF